ncbi:hypothetical protein ATM99_15940 [Cellulomonas sp. B6]|nr:hypothetical protein ATM99_15940 [Cellulomonas sp. B6]
MKTVVAAPMNGLLLIEAHPRLDKELSIRHLTRSSSVWQFHRCMQARDLGAIVLFKRVQFVDVRYATQQLRVPRARRRETAHCLGYLGFKSHRDVRLSEEWLNFSKNDLVYCRVHCVAYGVVDVRSHREPEGSVEFTPYRAGKPFGLLAMPFDQV